MDSAEPAPAHSSSQEAVVSISAQFCVQLRNLIVDPEGTDTGDMGEA